MGCATSVNATQETEPSGVSTPSVDVTTPKQKQKKRRQSFKSARRGETFHFGEVEKHASMLQFGALARGHHANQDIVVVHSTVSAANPSSIIGVFDGHGSGGGRDAAQFAVDNLSEFFLARLASGDLTHDALQKLMVDAFTGHQEICASVYNESIAGPMKALQEAYSEVLPGDDEGTQKELQSLALPAEGGTTATVAVVDESALTVAWVGDSKLVVARADALGRLVPVFTTTDHNIHCDAECERVASRGGARLPQHFTVEGAEGMLQVSRSLGDVPFHKNDAVSATPDVHTVRLELGSTYVVLAGSDGLWDEMPVDTCLTAAATFLPAPAIRQQSSIRSPVSTRSSHHAAIPSAKSRKSRIAPVDVRQAVDGSLHTWNRAMRLADHLEQEAKASAMSNKHKVDDISVVALFLLPSALPPLSSEPSGVGVGVGVGPAGRSPSPIDE